MSKLVIDLRSVLEWPFGDKDDNLDDDDDDDDNDDDEYLNDNMLVGKHIWSGRVLPISKHARPHGKILPQCPDPIEISDHGSNSNSMWSDP